MWNDCLLPGARDVAAKRKVDIRAKRVEPPKPPRMVNFDDVLTAVKKRLDYAEKRRDEEARNGEDYDVRYWAAYRDGVKGTLHVLEQAGGGDDV